MFRRIAISALFAHLSVAGLCAQAEGGVRRDTPSGFPVPRFVSLKDDITNCRTGPSLDHPVKFVFQRAGLPVMVVAESVDHWRKVRDSDGDQCWVHETTLRAQSQVLFVKETPLFRKPALTARPCAHLSAGVMAKLIRRRDGWVLVAVGDSKGWASESAMWGGGIDP